MKKSQTFTVLAALSIAAAIWECWTILNREDGDTFSATIRQLGKGQPFVVFMSGMLCGHLWWPLVDGETPPQPTATENATQEKAQ